MPAWSEFLGTELIGLLGATLLAGLVRGYTGFGAGLVMAPVFSWLLSPAEAIPLLILLEIVASLRLVPAAFGQTRWRLVTPMGIAACCTIPLGILLLESLDELILRRSISGAVLMFVMILALGWRTSRPAGTTVGVATGLASGLLSGAAGIGGPPVVLLVLSGPEMAGQARSHMVSFLAITQTVAIAIFAWRGLLDAAVLQRAAILFPFFLLATHWGARLFEPAREQLYRRMALVLLAVIGLAGLLAG